MAESKSMTPNSKTGDERRQPDVLYFNDSFNNGLQGWAKADDGAISGFYAEDEVPEQVAECAPLGWSVWDGAIRRLTTQDMEGEDGDLYRVEGCDAGDYWWTGELRPATGIEVLSFFDLAAPRPEGVEREEPIPICSCATHWPGQGHPPDCPVRVEIESLRAKLDANLEELDHLRALTHQTQEQERALYYRRCGWCGAYEGTVDPDEPCRDATDPATGQIMGPHQFGVYEPARSRAVRTVKLAALPQPTEEDEQ